MAQWLVMQGDTKFPVDGLAELEALARRGGLRSGDMIQPPGTTDWLYATEIPELAPIIARHADDDDDDNAGSSAASKAIIAAVAGVMAVGMIVVILVGGGAMLYFAGQLQGSDPDLVGTGKLAYSEMIVTSPNASLRDDATDTARSTASVAKDESLELLAKRGEFYRAKTKAGVEGWIAIAEVIPMYQLGGADVKQEYDPLYNPDRYVDVENARWMQLPGENPKELSNVTVFEFVLSNSSKYPMTDLKVLATIKDAQGHELERVEMPVEGILPASDSSFVGTLSSEPVDESGKKKPKKDPNAPPDRVMTTWSFEQLAAGDPDLQLRWTSGVSVEMKTEAFANAEIDVVELRAAPDKDAAQVVRRN